MKKSPAKNLSTVWLAGLLVITSLGGAIATSGSASAAVDFVEATSAGKEQWNAIASSADGKKLVAVSRYMMDDSDFGTVLGRIFTSTDSGVTWAKSASAGLGIWNDIASSSDGTKLVAAAQSVGLSGQGGIFTSNDSGATWVRQTGASAGIWLGVASSSDGAKLVAFKLDGSLFTSTDYGVTWTEQSVPGSGDFKDITANSDGTKLAAVRGNGNVYTSTDSGLTWKENAVAAGIRTIAISSSSDGTKLVAAAQPGPSLSTFVSIFTSNDSGSTWTEQTGAGQRQWSSVSTSADGTKIIASTWYSGGLVPGVIYTSTDSGVTWVEQSSAGLGYWSTVVISGDGTTMAAGDLLGNGTNGRLVTYTGELPSGPTGGAPAPTVTAVSPNFGPTGGGTSLTITGTGFVDGASVKVGDKSCLNVVVVSATSITCSTPAGSASEPLEVSVTNADTLTGKKYRAFYFTTPQTSIDVKAIEDTYAKSSSATQTATITNSGQVDLIFGAGAVALAGANPSDFVIVADNCSSRSVSPSSTCSVDYKFAPQAIGRRDAYLVFAHNTLVGSDTVPITGNGLDPFQASQPAIPSTTVATISPIQTQTITNLGDVDMVFGANAVTLNGPSAGNFKIVTDNCSNSRVAADGTCTVTYTFNPTVAGDASADLVFTSNSISSPNSVLLEATGLITVSGSKRLSISIEPIEKTYLNSSSALKTATITNKGTSNITIGADAVDIPGLRTDNWEDFKIVTDNCSKRTLVSNATCTVKFNFSPIGKGTRTARLVVASDAVGSPTTATLRAVALGNISIKKLGRTSGPTAGGSTFTIIGSGFDKNATVKIGSKTVPVVKRVGSVNIKIRTKANKAGKVSLVITNADGGKAAAVYTFN